MMKKVAYLLIMLFTLQFELATEAYGDTRVAYEQRAPITLGIFPRRNAKMTFKMFKPMADYLSQALKRPVKLVTAKNFSQFWTAVQRQEFDLVHYNQLHYIESAKSGYRVILMNEEFGEKTMSGALAVRNDSNINSVEDLRGKRILFGGGRTAMVAYIINTTFLREAGLGPNDYQELFAKNPPNAALAMYHKRVDAAGIGDVGLKIPILKKSVNTKDIKLILTSKKLSHLPWAVKADMPDALAKKIQSLLAALNQSPEGRQVLHSAKLTKMHIANDTDYNEYRKILEQYRQYSGGTWNTKEVAETK